MPHALRWLLLLNRSASGNPQVQNLKYFINALHTTALFFFFICWVTLEANLDQYNTFIMLGRKIPGGDKIGHFLVYGIMALLLNYSLRFARVSILKMAVYTGSIVVLGFAIIEEFTQLAFESRTFDYADMVSDIAGIAMFSLLSLLAEGMMSKNFAVEKD